MGFAHKVVKLFGMFSKRVLLWVGAGCLILAQISQANPLAPIGLQVSRIEGSTLVFSGLPDDQLPKPLKTGLQEIRVFGFLQPNEPGALPYVLLTAKAGEDRAAHLLRVDGGKQTQLVHPGRIMDTKTGVKILDSQAFFGKCRADFGPSYVAFQTEVVDKKRRGRRVRATEPSMLILEPRKDTFNEKLQELRTLAQLEQRKRETLRHVKNKDCFAIEGRNRTISTGPINLRIRREAEEEDEEEEEASAAPAAPGSPTPPSQDSERSQDPK